MQGSCKSERSDPAQSCIHQGAHAAPRTAAPAFVVGHSIGKHTHLKSQIDELYYWPNRDTRNYPSFIVTVVLMCTLQQP